MEEKKMNYMNWKEINVNVSEVLLDDENPRVYVDTPTQENLLKFLLEEEGGIELARSIYENRGIPIAEKPVVILVDGKYIVVEGNRRIAACKILYDPSLCDNKKYKVPQIDETMKRYLENLPVVLAPSRNDAEPFITIRHSGHKGIKRWSTISAARRFTNRYRKGESIKHIADVLGETESTVRKGIRFYMFLEYVINNLNWTEEEKKRLELHRLETTILDRFLPFSQKAKEVLKIKFLPDHSVTTSLPIEKFNLALKNIIYRIYFSGNINTRSKADDVFNSEVISICQINYDDKKDNVRVQKEDKDNEVFDSKESGVQLNDIDDDWRTDSKSEDTIRIKNDMNELNKGLQKKKNETIRSATKPENYTYLTSAYDFNNKYRTNRRINTLVGELRSIKYKEMRMSTMFLIRALLETYTNVYIDHFIARDDEKRIKNVPRDRKDREKNKKLRDLLFDHIRHHLSHNFPEYNDVSKLLEVTFTKNNNTATSSIINYYIHSHESESIPDTSELLDCWKKVSSIVSCLDEILFNEEQGTSRS